MIRRLCLMALLDFLILFECVFGPPQQISGGGVETGNTTAIGRVVSSVGASLSAMTVTAQSDIWGGSEVPIYKSTVPINDSGYYFFDSLSWGQYRVSGIDPKGVEGFIRTFSVNGRKDSVFIGIDSLHTVGHLKGKITRYEGTSPAGISVGLRGTSIEMTVSAEGAFDFARVPPGEHILSAQAAWLYHGIPQFKTILVKPGDTVDVPFFLPKEQAFALNIFPGQVWSYRCKYKRKDSPTTLLTIADDSLRIVGFSYFVNEKDTVINNLPHHAIRQCSFESFLGKTVVQGANYLYVGIRNDTVYVYESYGSTSIPGLLKRSLSAESVTRSSLDDSMKIIYDTANFNDFRIPVIFNIAPNFPWYSRPRGDRNGNLPLVQHYAGNEIVSVPGGMFNCMRMEWKWADSTPVIGVNFVSDIGTILGVIEDTGNYVDEFDNYSGFKYYSEYMGTDTAAYLKAFPRLPDALWDSIWTQVLAHWSVKRYREWMWAVDSSGDYSLQDNNSDPLYELLPALNMEFDDHRVYFDALADTLFASPDTLPHFLHLNPERLVHRLLTPGCASYYAQGWDDCDWDFKKQGLYNWKDTVEPYGHSAMAKALYEKMGRYYLYVKQSAFGIPFTE